MSNELQISKEQTMLMPVAENFLQLFPELSDDKSFNPKQAMISMALQLKEVKDKTGRPAIETCTKESILQVAQEVLVKKVDLMKHQASLIAYGNKLQLQLQYQGNVKRALDLNPFLDHFNFMPIYDGDDMLMTVLPDGRLDISQHKTKFSNIDDNKLVGGYVRAIKKDGSVFATEIMTIAQIRKSWSMSKSGGDVHKKFPVQMARKTILNKLCSWLINTTGEVDEFEYELENNNAQQDSMSIEIDNNQEYSKPTEYVDAEPVEEELPFTAEEPQFEEPETVTIGEPFQDDFDTLVGEEEKVVDDLVCHKCGAKITQAVSNFSKSKFGRPLCMKCQKEA